MNVSVKLRGANAEPINKTFTNTVFYLFCYNIFLGQLKQA